LSYRRISYKVPYLANIVNHDFYLHSRILEPTKDIVGLQRGY